MMPPSATSLALLDQVFGRLANCPCFVKDRDLRYVLANQAMLDMCGLRHRRELIGHTPHDIYPPAHAARFEAEERRVLAGEAITDWFELIEPSRQAPTWLLLGEFPLIDEAGEIVGVVGVSRFLRQAFASQRGYDGFAMALQHMREHFDKPLDCGTLAKRAGVSVSRFEREFARLLNTSPRTYQQRIRIDEARRLLAGDATIVEIANACGFADHSSFSRRFKLVTGETPSEYRAHLVARR
ncbi:AraC family transcriptional regulator [Sphingomonas panacisoli]|uniref:AraC family transcriptional regulator n=1 Tax=Sphingomonas panacisoli TaxID=1813879 RepID=A0A5B8LJ76_9SPHN|nr:AraC family transcriptional regulator [Sphingomonas panacisoli]QDZ08006.1 AraC family transcriptional regulator [Sphingomonas panacisoli]